MNLLLSQLGMATIIVISMVGVFFPEKIQRIELKFSEALTFGIPNPLVRFLESEQYLRMVRVLGAVSILTAIAAEYLLFHVR